MTIYCFLAELEIWRSEHEGNYPEEIYFQVDGGSENANKYVLAILELLVSKRMARTIVYTRLPTGHTHEDIDSCFGHTWKHMRKRTINTVQEYEDAILKAFSSTARKAFVHNVYVIPNYIAFLTDSIDRYTCIIIVIYLM